MPTKNVGSEWFEAEQPGWRGMTAHVGGLHLAQLRIAERMAKRAGDDEFARECAKWIAAGAESMEKRLWAGSYYLNYLEPETGRKSDLVFGYQLDGEWVTDHHALPGTLSKDRVKTVLDTITRCNVALTKYGAVNYPSLPLSHVFRTGQFWTICLVNLFLVCCLMLIMLHIVPHVRDSGIPPIQAAGVLSTIGAVSMLGRFFSGLVIE